MNAPVALRHARRLWLAYVGAVLVCLYWGPYYVRLMLPLYQQEIRWLSPQYRLQALRLVDIRGERAVVLSVAARHAIPTGSGMLPAGLTMSGAALRGYIYQHLVVTMCLILTWPVRRLRDYAGRMAFAVPMLLAVEALDVPQVLLGSLADLLASRGAPSPYADSLRIYWMNFLNGGGRLLLSMSTAILALTAYRLATERMERRCISPQSPRQRNAPG